MRTIYKIEKAKPMPRRRRLRIIRISNNSYVWR